MRPGRRGDVGAVTGVVIGALAGVWLLGLPGHPFGFQAVGDPGPFAHEEAPPVGLQEGGIAFHASSLGSGFAIQGDHGGRLVRIGRDLQVTLSPALVRPLGPAEPNERLANIRLALAEDTPNGWTIVSEGPNTPIGAAVVEGRDLWLSGLRLTLPDVSEEEMVGRWLVVVHELVRWDGSGDHTAWTYAHADRETFPRLMGWLDDGC